MSDTTRSHNIKRAVTFYSWRFNYFKGDMTLEDCIATAARLDIPGIEVIGDQMIRGYPNIPDAFIEQWHGWMEKYGRTPVCLDQFIDWNKYRGRVMTEDERVAVLVQDIKNASKLGCSVLRRASTLWNCGSTWLSLTSCLLEARGSSGTTASN
jgi:hypothetical protein